MICSTHLKCKICNAWKWERIRTKTNLRMMELRNPFKNVEIALSSEKAKEGSSRLYHKSKRLKVKGWKIFGKQATFHHVIFILVHTIISSKIWDSGTFSTYSWIWGRLQLFPTGELFWHIKIAFRLNVILLLSLQDKLPFFKPLPTTMNHQQCRQGTPTEVVVSVLCLSTKVMCITVYVYAQCVCTV